MLKPRLRDLNRLHLLLLVLCDVSLDLGVRDNLLELLWLKRVEHREEVSAVDLASLCQAIRQMPFQLFMVLEHLKDISDVELLIERHIDRDDIGHLHQLLFISEDTANEILIDVMNRWQIVLH